MPLNLSDLQPGKTYAAAEVPSEMLGKEVFFNDINFASSADVKPYLSGRQLRARVVLNDSAGALLPKRCAKYSTTNGEPGRHVGAMTSAGDKPDGVVDPWLAAAGVADQRVFLLFFDGPIICESDGSGTIAIGDHLITAGSATGKVKKAGTPADATASVTQFKSTVGYAEDADSGPTDGADIVVRINNIG